MARTMTNASRSRAPAVSRRLLSGALSGVVATATMTVAMLAWRRARPRAERASPTDPVHPDGRESLPPVQVTGSLLKKANAEQALRPGRLQALTAVGHVGYGATNGAVYSGLRRFLPGPGAVAGAGFGTALWVLGYAGWLPGLTILAPPTRKPQDWNAMNVASHLVYGAVLGALVDRLEGALSPSNAPQRA